MILEAYLNYGTACTSICEYLIHKNNSTLNEIYLNTKLDKELVYNGIALLLQRSILTYYKSNKKYYYTINNTRRVLYSLYLSFIKNKYDTENYKHFFITLVSGYHKLNSSVMEIFRDDYIKSVSFNKENKKGKSNLFSINFEKLDKDILDTFVQKYLEKKYSKSMSEIYKSIKKCNLINNHNILSNLESNQILIKDDISYINEVSNINEYVKYLVNDGILVIDVESNTYKVQSIQYKLQIDMLTHLFKLEKRLIKGFDKLKFVRDSEVGKVFLSKNVKNQLIKLLEYNILEIKGGDIWKYNDRFMYRILGILEDTMKEVYKDMGDINSEEFILGASRLNYLGYLYFIFMK